MGVVKFYLLSQFNRLTWLERKKIMKKLGLEEEGKMRHKSNTQAITVKLDNNDLTINTLIYL